MLWIEIDNSVLRENRLGFGQRPALLLIDFVQAYTSPSSCLYASGMSRAVDAASELLSFARESNIPVIHTNMKYAETGALNDSVWFRKSPSLDVMKVGNPLSEFCESVAPAPGEVVVTKQYPSAFFGTDLEQILREQGIDTIVLAGGKTSSGIRATAVDGIQHGFRVIVVKECVGDSCSDSHRVNLCDIDNHYGDVVSKDAASNAFGMKVSVPS